MYYADIITKDDLIQEFKEERLVIRKMFNNIKSCKHAITQSLLAKPRDVHEVVIYKHFETKPSRIHGYYEWTGEKLKLNKGIDPFIHNVLYGRM